jgi:hypothetical protein
LKNSENALPPRKWLNQKMNGTIRIMLLKSFPMNGNVLIFWAISVSCPASVLKELILKSDLAQIKIAQKIS